MLRGVEVTVVGRTLAVLVAVVGLAGCGQPTIQAPSGPRATPAPSGAAAVIKRSCATTPKSDISSRDVTFMKNVMIRQQAQLQRVADDLSGAVPGGDLPTDTQLAQVNARQLVDLVGQSTLCSPFKENLLKAAQGLAAADEALAHEASGGDVAGALPGAQAALAALEAVVDGGGGG